MTTKPHFDIKFKQKEGSSLNPRPTLHIFYDADLFSIETDIHDYLRDGYEMLIKNTGQDEISNENIEYVLSVEAKNMLEVGFPIEYRLVDKIMVLWLDKESLPFGRKAREFYDRYLDEETFNTRFPEEEKESLK